jgi:GntR family transcriptional regulator/MocR family aminotransferase
MSRARLAVGVSALIRLDRAASESLGTQLIRGLRNAVLEGRLRAGHRLPPTRILASELGVSRNAVLYAFEQLVEEGYLRGRVGSGTYVREDLPETVVRAPPSSRPTPPLGRRQTGRGGQALVKALSTYSRSVLKTIRPFHGGLPALDAFPFALWTRLAAHAWRRLPQARVSKRPIGHAAQGVASTPHARVVEPDTAQSICRRLLQPPAARCPAHRDPRRPASARRPLTADPRTRR